MYQLSGNAIQFFNHILAKENKKVFVAGHYSPEGSVKVGVPQGSVLGPLLFNIYINEVDCDMFADDSSLSASGNNIAAINAKLQPRSN